MYPNQLTPKLKEHCVDVCDILIQLYEAEEDGLLQYIITGNECCVHYFQYRLKESIRTKKFFVAKNWRTLYTKQLEIYTCLFWDCKTSILEHYMSKVTTIIIKPYCEQLENHLKPASKSKLHSWSTQFWYVVTAWNYDTSYSLCDNTKNYGCIWSYFHILHIPLTSHCVTVIVWNIEGGTMWKEIWYV